MKYVNGDIYEGDFVNGKKQGQGTYTYTNGDYYVGNWEDGNRNGYGKQYIKATKTMKEGTWKNDAFVSSTAAADSKYEITAEEAQRYAANTPKEKLLQIDKVLKANSPTSTGCVSGNCVNGFGKYIFSSGNIYEGNWVNNKKEGKGKFKFANGDIYEGDFVNNYQEGQGTAKFKNGDVYVGQFSKGFRSGKGKLELSNGDIYEGDWVNDNFEGRGTYTLHERQLLHRRMEERQI